MVNNLTTLPYWKTVKEEVCGVGLAKILLQVCHKKGCGVNQQMLNLVQVTKDAFMCWQQRYSVGTYHERFLATLEVAEAVNSMIGRDVSTAKTILGEWGLETANPIIITKGKREGYFSEGEKRFSSAVFFSVLLDHKYGELKDNIYNSYLAVVGIIS